VPDLVAPGEDIISAVPGRSYKLKTGTSMAAPHIAGLAALLWEALPDATDEQVKAAILRSCRRSSQMMEERANHGFPNAVVALKELELLMKG
jgi:subtilisin family serine protease